VKNRFQSLPFNCNLQRYIVGAVGSSGGGCGGGGGKDINAATAGAPDTDTSRDLNAKGDKWAQHVLEAPRVRVATPGYQTWLALFTCLAVKITR
jgi:hypothetical protein